jgi:hypothetical protein
LEQSHPPKKLFGNIEIIKFYDSAIIGIELHHTADSIYKYLVMNELNPFVQWLLKVKNACEQELFGLDSNKFRYLVSRVVDAIRYSTKTKDLVNYLSSWTRMTELSEELSELKLEEHKYNLYIKEQKAILSFEFESDRRTCCPLQLRLPDK